MPLRCVGVTAQEAALRTFYLPDDPQHFQLQEVGGLERLHSDDVLNRNSGSLKDGGDAWMLRAKRGNAEVIKVYGGVTRLGCASFSRWRAHSPASAQKKKKKVNNSVRVCILAPDRIMSACPCPRTARRNLSSPGPSSSWSLMYAPSAQNLPQQERRSSHMITTKSCYSLQKDGVTQFDLQEVLMSSKQGQ